METMELLLDMERRTSDPDLHLNGADTGQWVEYRRLVLHQLQSHETVILTLRAHITKLEKDILALKTRAGMWGLVGGAVPVGGLAAVEAVKMFV